MKTVALTGVIAFFALTADALRAAAQAQFTPTTSDVAASMAHAPICAAGRKVNAEPLFDDLGHWHHPISTTAPDAQRYFDQGLRLVYAFNHEEAINSFRQAAAVDPECAMCFWGIALALGPNINLPIDPEREKSAFDAVSKAKSLEGGASESDRAYIDAQAKRYSDARNPELSVLQRNYADAMRDLAHRYPDDMDASTLFAESMLDLSPWNQWTAEGKPQPGTEETVAVLERVLAREPNHPGANHYYIHAVEGSRHPERALQAAARLPSLMPGAGHIVHMPSHIYMRTGDYSHAASANVAAIAADKAYIKLCRPSGMYPLMYYPHNIDFLFAASSMAGRSADAIAAARQLAVQAPPEAIRQMPMIEFAAPKPIFALARFGKWTRSWHSSNRPRASTTPSACGTTLAASR